MTKTKQDKRARPAAVELHEKALDRAAGGVLASGAIGRGITSPPAGGNYNPELGIAKF